MNGQWEFKKDIASEQLEVYLGPSGGVPGKDYVNKNGSLFLITDVNKSGVEFWWKFWLTLYVNTHLFLKKLNIR